jgi:octaprenyl-diphosphate synthase
MHWKKTSVVDRKRIVSEIKRNHKNKQKVQEIIDFAIKNGGLEYTQQKMNEYRDKALTLLNEFSDNPSKKSLVELVNYVVSRKK